MKKFVLITLILIVAIVLTFMFTPAKLLTKYFLNDCPANGPVKQTDFEMYSESVDLAKYKDQIFSYNDIATANVLETIKYQDKDYEIYQVDIQNSQAGKNLLIFAATHGNEFASALAIEDLLNDVRQNNEMYKGWNIRIITPVNPVGLAHESRYNENGCDINRDFENFSTVGAKIQKQAIEQFKPQVVVSLHEGPQDGFFVIAESPVSETLRKAVLSNLKKEEIHLAQKSFLAIPLSDSGLWYKKSFVYGLQKLFSIHTLGRYAHENNLAILTTESPWTNKNVESRKKPHLIVIKSVIENF